MYSWSYANLKFCMLTTSDKIYGGKFQPPFKWPYPTSQTARSDVLSGLKRWRWWLNWLCTLIKLRQFGVSWNRPGHFNITAIRTHQEGTQEHVWEPKHARVKSLLTMHIRPAAVSGWFMPVCHSFEYLEQGSTLWRECMVRFLGFHINRSFSNNP